MPKDVGIRLKELRKNAGYTLEYVGKAIGVTRATVQRYESGEIKNIPWGKIVKLSILFHVSVAFILGW